MNNTEKNEIFEYLKHNLKLDYLIEGYTQESYIALYLEGLPISKLKIQHFL